MKPIIFDNFLKPEEYQYLFFCIVKNPEFPWFIRQPVSVVNANDGYYLQHNLYGNSKPNSNFYDVVIPILHKINMHSLIRINANWYPSTEKILKHEFHKDYPYKHYGALYYLNTNNGKTIFESGEEIESIENRLLLFDASTLHKSTTCTDDAVGRYNINFNFFGTSLINEETY